MLVVEIALWVLGSVLVAELIGYLLHRLLHSDRIRFLSRNHMIHHLVLYGPLQPQRPSPEYLDATTNRAALGGIGLEWLLPSSFLLALFLGVFSLLHVRPIHQAIFVVVTLSWSFLMFSYLHDRMHLQDFWMLKNPLLKRWFLKTRRLHDVHHIALNNAGLMDKNFGIGFHLFDRIFGSLSWSARPFNREGYEAARKRYAFIQE
jgi:sterol desaturase/sphingolipid hydroxylase (fatty acid hydroxylase superfamily)